MKIAACLLGVLILGQTLSAVCQDRGGDVRLRISNDRGQKQANETQIYANSYALLIGNTKYQNPSWNDLPDVDSDIAAVREVLESRHGFKVEVALNQTRESLLRTIDQFISKYGQRYDNRLLIYYSGHGYTALLSDERKMGYLVLSDAPAMPDEEQALRRPPTDEEFEHFLPAAITMDEIETYARRITAKHVLFVFDSCFSGTVLYKDVGTSVPTLITTEELKPVRAYLTAGNETQRVPAFSKFRRKFVAGLMGEADMNGDGYILGSELGRWVSLEVEKDTGRKQTPVFGKSDLFRRGDMVFVSPKKINVPTAFIESKTGEQLFWSETETRNTIAAYERYLSEYSGGEYVKVARLRIANFKWTNLKRTAQKLLKYDFVSSFRDERARVRIGGEIEGKGGFIDRDGNEVIPANYEWLRSAAFSEGLAAVEPAVAKGYVNLEGFINQSGDEVIRFKYDFTRSFSEGLALVELGGVFDENRRVGFVDRAGKETIPLKYNYASSFSEGLAQVQLNQKHGFVDKLGKEVIPLRYDSAVSFSEGLALVSLNQKYFYISPTGARMLDADYWVNEFFPCFSFSEQLACYVDQGGKYGYLAKSGKVSIPAKYDRAGAFSEGLAIVGLNGKQGFIDRAGKVVIQIKYDYMWEFREGLAKVRVGSEESGKYGFINRAGEEVIPARYDDIWCEAFTGEGFIGAKRNGRKGFVDIYGNEYFEF